VSILKDKVCAITGAGGGIGRALALGFAAKGARLILSSRDAIALESTCAAVRESGHSDVQAIVSDLSRDADALSLAGHVGRSSVDILVNNAGVFPTGPFLETGLADLDACLTVNLRAPFALSRAAAPHMVARKWGRIVNIGSSSAYMGVARSSLYCASKHALLGLSRALHAELRDQGVRVFCISPGSVKTRMGKDVQGQDFETFIEPEEVARAVLFAVEEHGNLVCDEIRLNRMSYQ
jgi:3-oxoacyl-[acyl-carrier protein] reductase